MRKHSRAIPAAGPSAIISQIAKIHEQMNRLIIRELERRHITGIVTSHGDILAALFKYEELAMQEVARLIRRDKSTVTALVNKLVNAGFIEKYRRESDRRVMCIRLTKRGRQLEPDFMAISNTLLSRIYRDFPEEEQHALIDLLNRIQQNIQDKEAHNG